MALDLEGCQEVTWTFKKEIGKRSKTKRNKKQEQGNKEKEPGTRKKDKRKKRKKKKKNKEQGNNQAIYNLVLVDKQVSTGYGTM